MGNDSDVILLESTGGASGGGPVSSLDGACGALHVRVPSHIPLPQLLLHHP